MTQMGANLKYSNDGLCDCTYGNPYKDEQLDAAYFYLLQWKIR